MRCHGLSGSTGRSRSSCDCSWMKELTSKQQADAVETLSKQRQREVTRQSCDCWIDSDVQVEGRVYS
jgi:hypothetical protein